MFNKKDEETFIDPSKYKEEDYTTGLDEEAIAIANEISTIKEISDMPKAKTTWPISQDVKSVLECLSMLKPKAGDRLTVNLTFEDGVITMVKPVGMKDVDGYKLVTPKIIDDQTGSTTPLELDAKQPEVIKDLTKRYGTKPSTTHISMVPLL